MIMASMRNWLHGGELHHGTNTSTDRTTGTGTTWADDQNKEKEKEREEKQKKRVAVVHCKAGKGRSGTVACSYLVSECGWRPDEALTRFTERRMRPKFGAGVSIPSQLRTVGYVDRWTRHGKRYVDRPVEIVEIHVWGLRDGVKVDVQGFADGGRRIQVFHVFDKNERHIVEGNPPESGGVVEMMRDLAGVSVSQAVENVAGDKKEPGETIAKVEKEEGTTGEENGVSKASTSTTTGTPTPTTTSSNPPPTNSENSLSSRAATFLRQASNDLSALTHKPVATVDEPSPRPPSRFSTDSDASEAEGETQQKEEPGGRAVILRPETPIRVPNSDVNIAVERRHRTSTSLGLTMVTAVAHVWFNAFFEGNGPEQGGKADASGVFTIDWDSMDGIKGSSRKGARALNRMAVVWRVPGVAKAAPDIKVQETEAGGEPVEEPPEGAEVPQMEPADWAGGDSPVEPDPGEKDLGLRVANPASADVSKASSVKCLEVGAQDGKGTGGRGQGKGAGTVNEEQDTADEDSLTGVRVSGPAGEEELGVQQDVEGREVRDETSKGR